MLCARRPCCRGTLGAVNSKPTLPTASSHSQQARLLAGQAFSRAAGAPLSTGNSIALLIDARAHFEAWLEAIAQARKSILFENYIISDDAVGQQFLEALCERAQAGVRVFVIRDWLGCIGQSSRAFWQPLLDAGGEVRTYNPPQLGSPLGWLSRDHRKSIMIDSQIGFLSGVCISGLWLGDARRGIEPWRDTGISLRGPAVNELVHAFGDVWRRMGAPLPDEVLAAGADAPIAGTVDLRVVSTLPNTAGLYRLDQLIAAMARERLWLTDAYFVGVAPYVQALTAASRDGVDVRLLVPGSSDIPAVGGLSRSGYRSLLENGVRVFEWNGSMMHAKSAVADGRWARVGSSNLNIASWIGNCEIDVAVENEQFAQRMEAQFLADMQQCTEVVLGRRRQRRSSGGQRRGRGRRGSSSRAAASTLRWANTVGAAITNRRTLVRMEASVLLAGGGALLVLAALFIRWPALLAWPLAVLIGWFGLALLGRYVSARRRQAERAEAKGDPR